MASLSEIVSYTDRFLHIREVGDWDNALNGLQIENSGGVTRIGAAVDVSTRVLTEGQKRDLDLLPSKQTTRFRPSDGVLFIGDASRQS
jgi:putative NIF3 family GTP cyclohydrolase 1 type 2